MRRLWLTNQSFQKSYIISEQILPVTDRRTPRPWLVENLAREAEGTPQNLIYLGTAVLIFLLATLAFVSVGAVVPYVLVSGTGFAFLGVAESLPTGQRKATLRLRLLGATVLMLGVVLIVIPLLGDPDLLYWD